MAKANILEIVGLLEPTPLDSLLAEAARIIQGGGELEGPLAELFDSAAKGRIKAGVTAVGIEGKLRAELEKLGVRSDLKLAEKRSLPVAEAEGKVAATRILEAPGLANFDKTRTLIEDMIKRPGGFNVQNVKDAIKLLPTDTHPERIFDAQNLNEMVDSTVRQRTAETRANLRKLTDVDAIETAVKFTEAHAQAVPRELKEATSLKQREILKEVIDIQGKSSAKAEFFRRAGEQMKSPEMGGLSLSETGQVGRVRNPLIGKGAGIPETQTAFNSLLSQATGGGPELKGGKLQVETALSRLPEAIKPAKAGPRRAGGKAGGIAALVGLPLILSQLLGGGGDQQEGQMPMAMQIQLMQQMAAMQQAQQGSDSLAGSRAASAQKNLAQADLLRLQMLQMAGGAAPAVV